MSTARPRSRAPIDPRALCAPGAIWFFGALVLATLVQAGALVLAARAFGAALADAVVRHDLAGSVHAGLLLAAALVGRTLARRIAALAAREAGERAARAATTAVLAAARGAHPDGARLAYLAGEGLAKLALAVGSVAAPALEAGVQIPLLLVLTWFASPILAVELVAGLVAMPVLAALIGLATDRRAQAQLEATVRLERLYLDLVAGASTLAAFGRSEEQAAVVDRAACDLERRTMDVLSVAFLSGVSLDVLSAIVVALVAVSIGIRLNDGSLPLAVGAAVLFWTPEVFAPLRAASLQFHTTSDGRAAASAIEALDAAPPPPVPVSHPVRWELRRGTSAPQTRLVVADVAPRELALEPPLSLALDNGDLLAVVGPSGVGKSTLLRSLALRAAPPSGSITLDGEPLAAHHLVWVPSKPAFVPGTLADNLGLLGGPAAVPAATAILVRLGGKDLAARLDEPIAPGGANLSAGQRQRIALARALALGRRLVVLDEPTSHLDHASEAAVIEVLVALGRDAIVVVATHRPRLVEAATHVIELAEPDEAHR